MTQATTTNTPSRRSVLGCLAAAASVPRVVHGVGAGATSAANDPDALHKGPNRIEDDDEREEVIEEICLQQEPIPERLIELRATTLEGFVTRFRTMLLEDQELRPQKLLASCYANERMMGAFLRDFSECAPQFFGEG